MAGNLGGLIVTLGLDATQYITGLTKSEQQAKKFADRLEKDVQKGAELAKRGFLALVGAAAAAGYAIERLLASASDFKDLEERTGAAAETLASYAVAAAVANTETADIATAMNKLSKNLTGVDDESKAAGAALTALGIPIAEFKKLDPGAQVEALAKAFDKFQDVGKDAVAMALFGKSGAQLLVFLKELAQTGPVKILSQEQIEQADAFSDSHKRVMATLKLYAQVASVEVIPAFTDIAKAVDEAVGALIGLNSATDAATRDMRLKELGRDIADWARTTALAIGTVVESFVFLGKNARLIVHDIELLVTDAQISMGGLAALYEVGKDPTFSGSESNAAVDKLEKLFAKRRKLLSEEKQREAAIWEGNTAITDAMRAQFDKAGGPAGRLFSDRAYSAAQANAKGKPRLDFEGAQKGGGSAAAKAIRDAGIKDLERVIEREKDLLSDRTRMLQHAYDEELIGFREYYAERRRAAEDALANILVAQDAEIEIARKFASRPGLKKEEKTAADEKVLELIDKQAAARRDATRAIEDESHAATRALRAYTDAVDELDAQVVELSGDLEKAALIRFDKQSRSLVAALGFEGNTKGLDDVARMRNQVAMREALNKATQEYFTTVQNLGTEQARIELGVRSGATTSLDAINKRSVLAKQYIGLLSQQADAASEAARRMAPGPEQDAALAKVQQLRVEIEALGVASKELENVFREVFVDTLANGLADVVTGTRSVKDAFKDMEKQIVAFLARMAAQNIAESIFGTKSGGSSSSGIIAKFIPFIASLFGGSAAGGLTSTGGGFGEHFASGGPVAANRPAIVGEKGAELFVPRAAGNIIPNDVLSNRRAQRASNVTVNVNVQGSTTRATADQVAVRTGAAVRRALSRNA